ncbi:MAG: hypothetical protein HYR72_11060 [Deltaproteobacteria bacterium]|nr:hypothetical protein [Deltaproteobacteria bacterium]MBI3388244.1 hypothetical protein [Deltaproteobacteria bacterium]
MKVVKLPAHGGGEVWLVVHQLTVAEGRLKHLRPIHVLTFLAQHLVKVTPGESIPSRPQRTFGLCLALENKLAGVRHHQRQLREAIAGAVEDVYDERYVRDYDATQAVICSLEAYLNAIYTALELVARINRLLHDGLPQGFRDQSKRFAGFGFERWEWLPHFYDVRTELTHFGTPLPILAEDKIVMEFTDARQLRAFGKGRYDIPFTHFLSYAPALFEMLDAWAVEELARVEPGLEIDYSQETRPGVPLLPGKVKAGEILALVNLSQIKKEPPGDT